MASFSRFLLFYLALGGWAWGQGEVASPLSHADRVGPALEAETLEQFLTLDPSDVVLGDPEAPLTLFDFSSFTCPHCGRLHRHVLPTIRSEYVETGKLKIVFRDFPLDRFALSIGLLGQCLMETEAYYGFIETVFEKQGIWRTAQTPMVDILGYAGEQGLSQPEALACLQNQATLDFLVARRQLAVDLVQVQGTPTLMLGNQRVPSGSVDALREALDKALAEL